MRNDLRLPRQVDIVFSEAQADRHHRCARNIASGGRLAFILELKQQSLQGGPWVLLQIADRIPSVAALRLAFENLNPR